MSENETPLSILRDIWSQSDMSELDAECNPNKICRNMQDINVEITVEAWREQLKKDGKWNQNSQE
jgi:hypothetical protein